MVGDELPRAEIGYAGAAALMGGLLRLARVASMHGPGPEAVHFAQGGLPTRSRRRIVKDWPVSLLPEVREVRIVTAIGCSS